MQRSTAFTLGFASIILLFLLGAYFAFLTTERAVQRGVGETSVSLASATIGVIPSQRLKN